VPDMKLNSKIYVAGHKGLVGSAILRRLEKGGFSNLTYRTHAELDLTKAEPTASFFESERPEYVFLAAAKVGGIMANKTYPADFIRINLQIQTNVIDAAFRFGVKKLLFLGSSCIFPRQVPQPMGEEFLLTGKLEPTNDAYAIAKIAGILMCKSYNRQHGTNFICAIPSNLYGPNDNFDLDSSHMLPATIRKLHDAKVGGKPSVEQWGTGSPRREFMYVDDLADAALFLMEKFDADPDNPEDPYLNVGTGNDLTIKEMTAIVQRIIGYKGDVVWNADFPDGTERKLLDVSRLSALGWKAKTPLEDGVRMTYAWFKENMI
jgi:GDP-L-fucose synthase